MSIWSTIKDMFLGKEKLIEQLEEIVEKEVVEIKKPRKKKQ